MAKKKQKNNSEEKDLSSYYKLKTQAVDDLVNADETNSPPVSAEELRKYHGKARPKFKISASLRAFLIKWWFAGAVCYFFWWGLTAYIRSPLDQFVIVSIALGVVTDLLTNSIFRAFSNNRENDRYMMFPRNTMASFFLNLLYGFVIMICVRSTYVLINMAWASMMDDPEALLLDVAPIFFGIFAALWDMLFVAGKNLFLSIVSDAKMQTGRRNGRTI